MLLNIDTDSFCLLEGTKVKTPEGYKAIEEFKEGDYALVYNSKTGLEMVEPVTKVGKWECDWEKMSDDHVMYKVPSGSWGAIEDVFISHYHKVVCDDKVPYPVEAGLEEATKEEICNADGKYSIYNLSFGSRDHVHMIVNGEARVESWHGEGSA